MKLSRPLSTLVAALVLALPMAPVPAVGAPTDSGARFVELKAPQPDWYTPALHDRVMAAAARGESVPIPEGVDYDTSGLAFTGIRPGAWIIAPAGCTTNFVFGSNSDYYIGTAGHCAEVGDEVTL